MDLESTISFLQRLYDNPKEHNFTRLEHEALREAISRLSILLQQENRNNVQKQGKPGLSK